MKPLSFTTFTLPIIHLFHSPPPSPWVLESSQGKIKAMLFFGGGEVGVNKVYYGQCDSGAFWSSLWRSRSARRAVAYNDCRSVKLYFNTRHFSFTSDVSFCASGPKRRIRVKRAEFFAPFQTEGLFTDQFWSCFEWESFIRGTHCSFYIYFTVWFLDQLKEADNGVIGPVPLVQDAANQDIRE